jgi:hypothetical protein
MDGSQKGKWMKNIQRLLTAGAILLLSACTTVSSISSTHEGTVVSLRELTVSAPGRQPLKSTSFTNFEFKAVHPGNEQPFYGVLPLEFRSGRLVADILLFAPGMFLNLRTAYPFYEFDAVTGVVRYKSEESEPWTEYRPTPAEVARAEAYFKANAAPAPQTGAAPAASP